jgi:ankyrin repeat protein
MLTLLLACLLSMDIHQAAYQEKLESVREQLAQGISPDARNRYGMTPLALAAEAGNLRIVQLLLEHKANPNLALPGGETPLMTAARTGRLEVVQALLAAGADPNAKEDAKGQSALLWAAAEGHADVVQALIEAGADFRIRLESGFTPLLIAARDGKAEVVEVLLQAGANPNDALLPAPDAKPRRGYRIGPLPKPLTSAMIFATLSGHFELAVKLVDRGADPNDNRSGWTALHAVSDVRKPGVGDNNPAPIGSGKMTSLEFVRALKERGADLNIRMTKRHRPGDTSINTLGATPFFIAARAADAPLMRLLADLGADPQIPNADDSSPLLAAAGLGTRSPGEDAGTEEEVLEAIALCLELGLDINSVDKNGETAMHAAAYKNLPKAVLLLAEKGMAPEVWNRPNKQGWTPLTIARGYRFGNFKPSEVTVEAFAQLGVR